MGKRKKKLMRKCSNCGISFIGRGLSPVCTARCGFARIEWKHRQKEKKNDQTIDT